MAIAYRLSQLGKPFIIVEKEPHLGGLSVTRRYNKYLYEYGPHAFHLKDQKIIDWLKRLLGKDFRVIPTNTSVFIDGKLYAYPLKANELLRKVRPTLGIRIIADYIWANINYTISRKNWQNFYEWGIASFGRKLYKISFGDYTTKVWGIDPRELSAKLATNKISKLNLREVIAKTMGIKGKEQPLFFKKYLYPEKGISLIFTRMAKETNGKGKILLQTKAIALNTRNNRVTSVTVEAENKKRKIACDTVVSTLPIKLLSQLVKGSLSRATLASANKLQYRDMMIVYVVVEEKSLPDSQWIYLVENKFQFNRVSINKNLSPRFCVGGLTLLAFEICCKKGDRLWNKKNSQLLAMVREDMVKLGWRDLKIRDCIVERISNAYPIYLVDFEKNVSQAIRGLSKIVNLISTGRNGLFLNSDIHDCFQMGFETADFVAKDIDISDKYYQKVANKWSIN